MERLFFAFVLIGTTLALQPVPPPYRTAKAFDTAYVTIATNQTYDPSKVKQYMDQFPQTKIQQYSSQLGDFRHLRSADVDGHFGFDFAIGQCVCRLVEQWVNQIVRSSQYYTSGHTRCLREQESIEIQRTATKTTTTSSPIAPQPAPPPYRFEKGLDTTNVKIVTNQTFDLSNVKQHMDYFPQTKIQQYANQLGDFSNLGYDDVNDNFAYTFTISHCVCAHVEQWVNQIVQSSQYYTSGNTKCFYEGKEFLREKIATTTPITTTTTTGSPIAFQPAPPPYGTGKGDDMTNVKIVTNQPYRKSDIKQYMRYFDQTKIYQYSSKLGDFSSLRYADVDGYTAFTFTMSNCICGYVEQWLNQIVQSSQYYTGGSTRCFYKGFVRERTANKTKTTTTTTITTASSPIVLQPAPPPAFAGRGHDTAYVTIATDQPYDTLKVNQYMNYFPKTKMEQYAWQLGEFSNLGITNIGGNFAFTFTIKQCVCGYVKKWVNQMVQSSQHYTSGDAVCFNEESPSIDEKAATTTTTASSSIAFQPVPPPPFHGRGRDTAQVTLVTNQPYDPAKVKQHMDYFPQTKIQQYANELGDFSNLGYADVDDNFAHTFTLSRSACEYVDLWVNRIVRSSPSYPNGNTRCFKEGSSFVREKTATRTTKTTAGSPILSPSDIFVLLNMPKCEKD